MPIYDYECPACGNVVEITRSANDSHLEYECPTETCTSMLVRKYSAVGIKFNGSGFYVNDSKFG